MTLSQLGFVEKHFSVGALLRHQTGDPEDFPEDRLESIAESTRNLSPTEALWRVGGVAGDSCSFLVGVFPLCYRLSTGGVTATPVNWEALVMETLRYRSACRRYASALLDAKGDSLDLMRPLGPHLCLWWLHF